MQCGICASSVVEGGEATSQRTQWDWWPPSWNGKGLKATSCCRRELSDETSTFRGRIHRYQVLGCARKKLFGGGFRFLGLAYNWHIVGPAIFGAGLVLPSISRTDLDFRTFFI